MKGKCIKCKMMRNDSSCMLTYGKHEHLENSGRLGPEKLMINE